METVIATKAIMVVVTVILIGWDIYVAFFNDISNSKDTESGILGRLGRRVSAIPLGWGILGGHFWAFKKQFENDLLGPGILVGIAAILSIVHWQLRQRYKLPRWSSLAYLLVGVPLGAVLWPN